MKNLIILILAFMPCGLVFGQQKSKIDYMTITIYKQSAQLSNMIVTRTDSAQKTINLKLKLDVFGREIKYLAAQDSVLLKLVKPYYDKGWKLISVAPDGTDFNNNGMAFRYYLSRESQ
jgi:hypothetical protein